MTFLCLQWFSLSPKQYGTPKFGNLKPYITPISPFKGTPLEFTMLRYIRPSRMSCGNHRALGVCGEAGRAVQLGFCVHSWRFRVIRVSFLGRSLYGQSAGKRCMSSRPKGGITKKLPCPVFYNPEIPLMFKYCTQESCTLPAGLYLLQSTITPTPNTQLLCTGTLRVSLDVGHD